MGVAGPWYERLPHFRMGFTPSSGKELQTEYFVARSNAADAIAAVERLRDRVSPHLMITELRTIDGDELWMSPCYRRPSLAIHFTWKPDWPSVRKVLPMIEQKLAPIRGATAPGQAVHRAVGHAPETLRDVRGVHRRRRNLRSAGACPSGRTEIYVAPLSVLSARTRVSNGGGWRLNGVPTVASFSTCRLMERDGCPIRTTPRWKSASLFGSSPFKESGRGGTSMYPATDNDSAIVPQVMANEQALTAVLNWPEQVRQ